MTSRGLEYRLLDVNAVAGVFRVAALYCVSVLVQFGWQLSVSGNLYHSLMHVDLTWSKLEEF